MAEYEYCVFNLADHPELRVIEIIELYNNWIRF